MDGLRVRFQDFEYYDIMRDCDVVQFQAITSIGTWSAELPIVSRKQVRVMREKFQQDVIARMQEGELPEELTFGDDETAG